MKAKVKTGALQKVKDAWNSLSFTTRHNLKIAAMFAGMFAAVTVIVTAAAFALPFAAMGMSPLLAGGSTAVIGAGILGIPGLLFGAPALLGEFRHRKEEVTWKNLAGQTVKGTRAQQKDLQVVDQNPIVMRRTSPQSAAYSPVRLMGSERLVDAFRKVADNVTVVKDVENGNGKYIFNPPLAPR